MLTWIAIACIVAAFSMLVALSVVDLRTRLLPDTMVLTLALLGLAFHIATKFQILDLTEMAIGAAIGAGVLLVIRTAANWRFKVDTLGLGDVKLMGAAGLWLGPDLIAPALMLGALAGLLHGVLAVWWHKRRTGETISFMRLQLPAGPGFAVGAALASWGLFNDFFLGLLS